MFGRGQAERPRPAKVSGLRVHRALPDGYRSRVPDLRSGRIMTNVSPAPVDVFEVIDSEELARRWSLPASWIAEQTRSRAVDPLPCVKFGKYVRFRWQSPELEAWLARRCRNGKR